MIMRCYFTEDKIAGKVLIPHCWEAMLSDNIKNCTCGREPLPATATFAQFEKRQYNLTVEQLNSRIRELEKEVNRLNRKLVKLTKNKPKV